jgi:hypothetical protein
LEIYSIGVAISGIRIATTANDLEPQTNHSRTIASGSALSMIIVCIYEYRMHLCIYINSKDRHKMINVERNMHECSLN